MVNSLLSGYDNSGIANTVRNCQQPSSNKKEIFKEQFAVARFQKINDFKERKR